MKGYSVFTLACSDSGLNSEFQQLSQPWLPILAGLAMIASVGCQSSHLNHAGRSPLGSSQTSNIVATQPRHRVAKPIIQSYAAPNQGQGSARGNGPSGRYPLHSQQSNTYPYPATHAPSQQPQYRVAQNGSQLAYPPIPQVPQQQFQPSQIQIPQPAYQLQQPGLQTGPVQPNFAQPNVRQPNFAQPNLAQPNLTQPNLAQPNLAQPGFGQPAQPGFFPNQNLGGQNFQSIQEPEFLDLDVFIPQNPSGRLSVGGTVSSDNSVLGQIILEEHDFDFRAWPRNPREIFSPYAWRGGGQRFRVEAVPGADLERYLVSWSDPYFRGTDTSLSLSGYLFERQYFDFDERRVGGRISLGRRLSQYLTFNAGLRLEDVEIDNPRVATSSQLNAALGDNNLFLGSIGFAYDNRVLPYLTGVGTYFSATYTQAFGDFDYSRGEIEFRNHQKIFARPDDSGRHIIGFRSILGFTGSSTPVFENFYAGGISTLRGFDFRGVSPIDGDARVGGEFQWLNSLEYTFPVTADDLVRGALFVDFGTVEEDIELNSENFRVAPGFGLRVHLPFAGLGAPLSFDFAFPVSTAEGDDERIFSFFIGAIR